MNLYEAFNKDIVELNVINDAGHNNISHYTEFNESMKECLNRKYLLPLDELEEVIEIENEHRASNL